MKIKGKRAKSGYQLPIGTRRIYADINFKSELGGMGGWIVELYWHEIIVL